MTTSVTVAAPTAAQTFAFAQGGRTITVRTANIQGEPWFIATDVCRALGLDTGVVRIHLNRLDADEIVRLDRTKLTPKPDLEVPLNGAKNGGAVLAISESGLYKLLMRSDKPNAKPFQDWVTREVLPTIRKTGSYEVPAGETMPVPAEFKDAFQTLVRCNLAMAEKLDAALKAVEDLKAIFASAQDDGRMLTASQLIAQGIVGGMEAPALGMRLTSYCTDRGIRMGSKKHPHYGKVRVYPVPAARAFAASL